MDSNKPYGSGIQKCLPLSFLKDLSNPNLIILFSAGELAAHTFFIYVDDIIIGENDLAYIDKFTKGLDNQFKLKDYGF